MNYDLAQADGQNPWFRSAAARLGRLAPLLCVPLLGIQVYEL